jgi:hypothetical protein
MYMPDCMVNNGGWIKNDDSIFENDLRNKSALQ